MTMFGCLRFRIICPSIVVFAVAISFFTTILHNWRFWNDLVSTIGPTTYFEIVCIASIFAVLVFVHASLLLLVPSRRGLQIVAAAIVVIGAVIAYFSDSLGIIVDKTIIRSLFDTDQQEVSALLTWSFAFYLFFLGIVPAVAIFRVQLSGAESDAFDFRRRAAFIGAAVLSCALLIGTTFSFQAPFWRANRVVLQRLNPDTALVATINYAKDYLKEASAPLLGPLTNPGGPTRVVSLGRNHKPLLLFLNVGETARAANFELGGYNRGTNPELSAVEGLFYFNNASSCGTVTAISVPCLFTHGGRKIFNVADAERQTNLLDAVSDGGYRVEWRENNSGGQGVPARVKVIEYGAARDPKLCVHGPCFDEIMIKGLGEELRAQPQNTMIVFHQMGSHGPAYWQRYPERFEKFHPACKIKELWRCPREELFNVYDNTILYTDFILAEQIRLMNALSDQFDTALIYASDHGESLGEKGLYLHGSPFMFAPKEQTKIPFLIWLSKGYRNRLALDERCLSAQRNVAISHDNMYHTVLGALGLANHAYRRELDLITPCAVQTNPG